MARKIAFRVEMTLPPGATITLVKQYIVSALQAECGHCVPEDPMFELDRTSIKATHMGVPAKA